MSVPHITWVCPSGRPHQDSPGPEGTCGLWNGKVKWVLSSSHKNDNPCVKSHVGDKCHGGQGQQWAHRLAHQPAREMAKWKDMAGRAGHELEGTANSSRALEEGSHQMVTERSLDSKHSCVEFQTNPCHINLCPYQYMFPTPEKPLTETTDPEAWIRTLPSWLTSFHRFSEYLYQI